MFLLGGSGRASISLPFLASRSCSQSVACGLFCLQSHSKALQFLFLSSSVPSPHLPSLMVTLQPLPWDYIGFTYITLGNSPSQDAWFNPTLQPRNVTQSQVLMIRTWTSLGRTIIVSTTNPFSGRPYFSLSHKKTAMATNPVSPFTPVYENHFFCLSLPCRMASPLRSDLFKPK